MTRSYVEAPATHFRLKPETWAIIAEEYKNGATAKDIGAKWKVAPSSVYRYACRDGWTKKAMGDARARAHAHMVEVEESSARSMNPVGSRALKTLFQPACVDDPDASDAGALARTATLASGRAMKGRLWAEAKALAGLAESYARLGEREEKAAGPAPTIETLPLSVIWDILKDPNEVRTRRFTINSDNPDDPDSDVKTAYWEWNSAWLRGLNDILAERTRQIHASARRAANLPPAWGEDDYDAAAYEEPDACGGWGNAGDDAGGNLGDDLGDDPSDAAPDDT